MAEKNYCLLGEGRGLQKLQDQRPIGNRCAFGGEKAPVLPNGSMLVLDVECIFRICFCIEGFGLC